MCGYIDQYYTPSSKITKSRSRRYFLFVQVCRVNVNTSVNELFAQHDTGARVSHPRVPCVPRAVRETGNSNGHRGLIITVKRKG